MKFVISPHAKEEMKRRAIPVKLLNNALENPQQIVEGYGGRSIYQSKVDFGEGHIFLLRAVVEDKNGQLLIVTVYKTRKINKYWRKT